MSHGVRRGRGTWDNGTAPKLEPEKAACGGAAQQGQHAASRWGPPHPFSTKSDKIIVMVGLPARGKSYISRRLSQYLSFFYNVPCKMFNVGDYRRGGKRLRAEFFNTNNATAMAAAEATGRRCETCASG